jgi:hypothetical protein
MEEQIAILAADEALLNVGTVEEGEDNHGDHIAKYLKTVKLDEGFAWCAAFVKYRFIEASKKLKKKLPKSFMDLSGWTPEWASWGKKEKRWITVQEARDNPALLKKGYLGLFYSNRRGRIYHIGVVIKTIEGGVQMVEGNTGPETDVVSADGDGVYIKHRKWINFGTFGGFIKTY